MDRATFWKSLGAVVTIEKCRYYFAELDFLQVGQGDGKFDSWIDPADAEEVPLEVLLGWLERLAKNAFVFYDGQTFGYAVIRNFSWSVDPKNILSLNPDRRTAIISAIERLITEAEE